MGALTAIGGTAVGLLIKKSERDSVLCVSSIRIVIWLPVGTLVVFSCCIHLRPGDVIQGLSNLPRRDFCLCWGTCIDDETGDNIMRESMLTFTFSIDDRSL